jgi:hypothetical protein
VTPIGVETSEPNDIQVLKARVNGGSAALRSGSVTAD